MNLIDVIIVILGMKFLDILAGVIIKKKIFCKHNYGRIEETFWDNANCRRVAVRECYKCGKRKKFY